MMTRIIFYVVIFVGGICLPSLMGAVFRLAAPKAQVFWIALGVGLFFAILSEALGTKGAGLLDMITSDQESITSHQIMGVLIIMMVVMKVGLFAALATFGVDQVDRRRRPQQHPRA
jgi:hypothetical protein